MPLHEFALIDQCLKPLTKGFPGSLSLTDDAALLSCQPGEQLVIAKDAVVEGVHFLPGDPPQTIAQKLLRANLSDLAAMGAKPLAYLTALMLPEKIDETFIRLFVSGLEMDQKTFGLSLIGGDITKTPGPISMSLTVIGTVPQNKAMLRSGAQTGDDIWVSGTLGDAALGLRIQDGLAADEDVALVLIDRYRRPRPRLALGQRLREMAHGCIDVSDGLVADLSHILEESNLSATINSGALPLSDAARTLPGAIDAALSGGDDYELLFTAAKAYGSEIQALSKDLKLRLSCIGETAIAGPEPLTILDPQGEPLKITKRGWQHL